MTPADPTLARALARWQHAAGPYWPYVLATPLLGDLTADDGLAKSNRRRVRRNARPRGSLAGQLADLPEGRDAAVFVDLAATETLPEAPGLSRLGFYVVPIIQRWATAPAVLPCEQLLAELVAISFQLARPAAPRGVVFLLDGDRAGRPGAKPGLRRFDNRYAYPLNPFPPAGFLKQHGVTAVYWEVRSGIASDLQAYARQLRDAGL